MTGRLRRNSTHGPSGTATNAPTARLVADNRETRVGSLCSTRMASSGNASKANQVPTALTAKPARNHPKYRPKTAPLVPPSVRCAYVTRQISVKARYRLWVTAGCGWRGRLVPSCAAGSARRRRSQVSGR
jgi:hypothetical protein